MIYKVELQFQNKLRSLVREYLKLKSYEPIALQVLDDNTPPYLATDRIEISPTTNRKTPRTLIIVGQEWIKATLNAESDRISKDITNKIYNEANATFEFFVNKPILIKYNK